MTAKNILITGRPRVGKTTLIKYCAKKLSDHAGGFYTEEIKGEGIRGRKGFCLRTLSGEAEILAEVDYQSNYKVGRYGVHLEVMDQLAVPAIQTAIKNKDWIIIDEIGRMEEGSEKFKNVLVDALNSNKRILATIRWHDGSFTRNIKSRTDVIIYKLTIPERHRIYQIMDQILNKYNKP